MRAFAISQSSRSAVCFIRANFVLAVAIVDHSLQDVIGPSLLLDGLHCPCSSLFVLAKEVHPVLGLATQAHADLLLPLGHLGQAVKDDAVVPLEGDVQFAFAGDVITQDTKQLPLTARNFINQYFSKPHISHIKIESEILQTKKYEVLLTDRTEIDFDKKGNWLEVDCKKSAVPEALIPVPVKEYVKANFPREIITKIDADVPAWKLN